VVRPIRSLFSRLRSDEYKLRLLFGRVRLAALGFLTGALVLGLWVTQIEASAQPGFTQMIAFCTAAAAGLLALALAGRDWLDERIDSTIITVAALVLSAFATYRTGGSTSYFAVLPLLITGLSVPLQSRCGSWSIAAMAIVALAAPLLYDFSHWYLWLAVTGWIFVVTLTAYATGIISTLGRKRTETRELDAFARASMLADDLNVEATLRGTVDMITGLLNPHACLLYLAAKDHAELCVSHSYFDPAEYSPEAIATISTARIPWGVGLIGSTAESQQPLLSLDATKDPRATVIPGAPLKPVTYIVAPMTFGEETLGVLRVSRYGVAQYGADDLTLASIFANQAAVAIANARMFEQTNEAERAARESEAHYERLTSNAGEVIMRIETGDFRATYINAAGERILGYSRAAFAEQPNLVVTLLDEGSRATLMSACRRLSGDLRAVRDVVLTWTGRDGRKLVLDHILLPVDNADGDLIAVETIARDVTQRQHLESQIRELTFTDQTTGIANRNFFEQELKRLDTVFSLPLTVVMADVNGLKMVNDAFGHAAGDRLLARAAKLLGSTLRRNDILCRVGGDEFALLLPGVDERTASTIIDRIRMVCAEAQPDPLPVSISIGSSTKDLIEDDIHAVMHDAEQRMYRSKLFGAKEAHGALISALQESLWRDTDETPDHVARVATLSEALADAMDLRSDQMTNITLFAELHDVGKVAVDHSIFAKAGPLTGEEIVSVRRHAEIGCRVALADNRLMSIADLILSHHEWWDGTGYPRGLRGEQIPVQARILAVADAYDVMTHARPYRNTMSPEQALAEIQACCGAQFDPSVVAALLTVTDAATPVAADVADA